MTEQDSPPDGPPVVKGSPPRESVRPPPLPEKARPSLSIPPLPPRPGGSRAVPPPLLKTVEPPAPPPFPATPDEPEEISEVEAEEIQEADASPTFPYLPSLEEPEEISSEEIQEADSPDMPPREPPESGLNPWFAQLAHGYCPPEGTSFARHTPPTTFPGRDEEPIPGPAPRAQTASRSKPS